MRQAVRDLADTAPVAATRAVQALVDEYPREAIREVFEPYFPTVADAEWQEFICGPQLAGMAEIQQAAQALQAAAQAFRPGDAAENRERVRRAITSVGKCDGTSPASTREWLRAIGVQQQQLGNALAVQVVDATANGRLQEVVEAYTRLREIAGEARVDRHWECRPQEGANPPQQGMGAYIRLALLGAHDASNLRRELATATQTDFEDAGAYMTRYANAATAAYAHPRDDLTEELLVGQLLRGLADKQVAYEVSMMRRPATLAAAEVAIREALKLKKALGSETPAPLAAITSNSDIQEPEWKAALAALSKDVSRLSTKVGEFKNHSNQKPRIAPTGYRSRGSGRGQPRGQGGFQGRGRGNAPRSGRNDGACFNCGRRGHFVRECRLPATTTQAAANPGNWQQGSA